MPRPLMPRPLMLRPLMLRLLMPRLLTPLLPTNPPPKVRQQIAPIPAARHRDSPAPRIHPPLVHWPPNPARSIDRMGAKKDNTTRPSTLEPALPTSPPIGQLNWNLSNLCCPAVFNFRPGAAEILHHPFNLANLHKMTTARPH